MKLGWELASVDQSAKSNTAKQAETMFQKECGDVGVPLPSLSVITDGFKQLLINNFDLMLNCLHVSKQLIRSFSTKKLANVSLKTAIPCGGLAGTLGALCGVGGGLVIIPVLKQFSNW